MTDHHLVFEVTVHINSGSSPKVESCIIVHLQLGCIAKGGIPLRELGATEVGSNRLRVNGPSAYVSSMVMVTSSSDS